MIDQYGALPWDETESGERRILLITSRDTRRWVIPRGNPMVGLSGPRAAAVEAWEEAGARGEIEEEALGSYRYDKRLPDGSAVPAEVLVFALRVHALAEDWPEKDERERRWFSPDEAAEAIDEPGLKALLLGAI